MKYDESIDIFPLKNRSQEVVCTVLIYCIIKLRIVAHDKTVFKVEI